VIPLCLSSHDIFTFRTVTDDDRVRWRKPLKFSNGSVGRYTFFIGSVELIGDHRSKLTFDPGFGVIFHGFGGSGEFRSDDHGGVLVSHTGNSRFDARVIVRLELIELLLELPAGSAVAHEYASQNPASNANSNAQKSGPARIRNIEFQLRS
jgi:hypothetical protein